MNFSQRGNDVLSCSALPRVRACPGSFLLSKDCPDTESEYAADGDMVHALIHAFATGQKDVQSVDEELYQQAFQMWGHAQKSATQFFGQDAQLEWRSEQRRWMASEDLEPILSGQFDLTCTSGANPAYLLLYDAKSGFLAGDVPSAEHNEQIDGMAAILNEETGKTILAAIVRPWASDQLCEMRSEWVRPWVESIYEHTDPYTAGLKKGEWCSYCPAKKNGRCPLFRDQLALVLKTESLATKMEEISPENLVRILKASSPAESVIEAAKKEAHRRREAGEELPGCEWKKGNQKRTIKDEEKILMRLKAMGIEVPTKLDVKLSDVEKAYGKAKDLKGKPLKDKFNQEFSEFLEISENAPSIEFGD